MFVNKTHQEAHEALKKGQLDKAIELYSIALKNFPDDPNLVSDRGVAYIHKNDEVKCFIDLNRAVQLQPNYAFRYACRAFAFNHFKNIDAAIKDYERAIELDPDDSVAHNNLGLLLEQKGYRKEAEERFDRADKLSKMEDHLLDLMDEMEDTDEIIHEEIDPSKQREKNIQTFKEMKKVFTSKKEFNDFIKFIKNGFKIK